MESTQSLTQLTSAATDRRQLLLPELEERARRIQATISGCKESLAFSSEEAVALMRAALSLILKKKIISVITNI